MEQHKLDVMEQNRLNAIVGRPLIPTPWLRPKISRDDEGFDEENAGDYDDYDDDDDGDGFDEEAYEDLE